MNPLRDYVEHWFAHTALRTGRPNWLKLTEQWINDVTSARPGFETELRQVALAALSETVRTCQRLSPYLRVPIPTSLVPPVLRDLRSLIAQPNKRLKLPGALK